MAIPWDQPATLIDLDGKTRVIGTILECVMHFLALHAFREGPNAHFVAPASGQSWSEEPHMDSRPR